jgi:hypothetical protein
MGRLGRIAVSLATRGLQPSQVPKNSLGRVGTGWDGLPKKPHDLPFSGHACRVRRSLNNYRDMIKKIQHKFSVLFRNPLIHRPYIHPFAPSF